jgi:uncharacterized protein YjeT (DUF2065 family)
LNEFVCRHFPDEWREMCVNAASFLVSHKTLRVIGLFALLYVILWILAQVNGLRRGATLPSATIKKAATNPPSIRLRRDAFDDAAIAQRANGRVARVKFWYLDGSNPIPIVSKRIPQSFILSVNAIDKQNSAIAAGGMAVDSSTYEQLEALMDLAPRKPSLQDARFRVKITWKLRGVLFLLRHPDALLRTTGWVTFLTGFFAVVVAAVFAEGG